MATNEDGRRQVPTQKVPHVPFAQKTCSQWCFQCSACLERRHSSRSPSTLPAEPLDGFLRETEDQGATRSWSKQPEHKGKVSWSGKGGQDGAHDGRRERREEVTCHTAGIQVNQRGGSRLAGIPCQELAQTGNTLQRPNTSLSFVLSCETGAAQP